MGWLGRVAASLLCVVWCPLAKGQRLLVKVPPPEHLLSGSPSKFGTDSSKLQPYLLGAWQEVCTVTTHFFLIGSLSVP